MRKIYYTDISNINLSDLNLDIISKRKLNKTKFILNESKKLQTLSAYLLLRYVFKKIGIDLNSYEIASFNGKPVIKELDYHFNITHSKNIVAVIISNESIGIDCEYIDLNKDLAKVSKYALSKVEYLEFLDTLDKHSYFYKKWVIKEAYFKMLGIGLSKKFKDITLDSHVFEINDRINNSYYLSTYPAIIDIEEINFIDINC